MVLDKNNLLIKLFFPNL